MPRYVAALAAVLALLLSGCGGSSDDADSDGPSNNIESSEPDVPRPEVGECRQLKPKDIPPRSNTTDPVDCSEPHTALTVKVIDVPERITRDTAKRKLIKFSNRCLPAVEEAFGGSDADRQVSLMSWAWFMPTDAEEKAGARWMRCDAIAGGDTTAELPSSTPFLEDGVPEELRECWTQSSDVIPCTEPHYYRAVTAVPWKVQGRYPPRPELESIGRDACRGQSGGGRYAWQVPNKSDWTDPRKDGTVLITCYQVGTGAIT